LKQCKVTESEDGIKDKVLHNKKREHYRLLLDDNQSFKKIGAEPY